jgi:hypothetical protein
VDKENKIVIVALTVYDYKVMWIFICDKSSCTETVHLIV